MMTRRIRVMPLMMLACILPSLPLSSQAWEPNARDRDAAIKSGDFDAYVARLGAWIDQQVPSSPEQISQKTINALLKDPKFMAAVAERRFLTRVWGEKLGDWVKKDSQNKEFLTWVLNIPVLMDKTMLARTPTAEFARVDDSWSLSTADLENWKKIYYADPASRKGLYLKMAVAAVIRPPGSANTGAGQAKTQSSVFDRYMHYRQAHENGELMPSFDNLSIWDMTHVLSSSASNDDLAWGREALNTWKPDFRNDENVVAMVSQVWRRGSQVPYNDMSCVAAGGGKCGPRSSFGVFINQAFGIPSIGVGQPAHAAITYRRPDGSWAIAQGRGFNVSKIFDRYKMSGMDFLAYTKERNSPRFAQAEHLRWLAGTIENPVGGYVPPADRRYTNPRAAAVYELKNALRTVAGKIEDTPFEDRKADSQSVLTKFDTPPDDGDDYFARVRGFVYPPRTGDYVFSISGDDMVDLFLSTDEDPAKKQLMISLTEWTEPTNFGHKSQPVHLEAGKRYYIEGNHREHSGGDRMSVAWSGPGISEEIIQGRYLSPFTPNGKRGAIEREVWKNQSAAPSVAYKFEFRPEAPIQVPPGVIHVEAEDFYTSMNVGVENCYLGGKQVYYPAMTAHAMCGYKINVPKTGNYQFTARVATINWGQQMYVRSFGAMYPVKNATASNVFRNQEYHGPKAAVDNDLTTRWAMDFGKEDGWLELDLGQARKISSLIIDERALNYISRHKIEYKVGNEWKTLMEGELMKNYVKTFDPILAQYIRLRTFECHAQTGGPTVREFSVGDKLDGNGFIAIPWAPASSKDEKGRAGTWQTTEPLDMYLVKGEQVIWVCTQTLEAQRSVAMRWFELSPEGRNDKVSLAN